MLSAVRVKGESHYDDVKAIVEREYITETKYKRLSNSMKGKSLKSIGEESKSGIQTAEVIFGDVKIGQFIREEPEVIGALFGALKDGKMTSPIKGKEGVYVVRIDKTIKAIPATDYVKEKDQMTGLIRGGLKSAVTKALVEQADVIDNRKFREINVRR